MTTRILFVCTANQCRSPLAEALAHRAAGVLPVEFASAGLLPGGYPVPRTGIRVGRQLGLDLATHVSRQVDFDTLARWDLVLTMTREQARELVAASPGLWPRVFTLKQFARWVSKPASSTLGAQIDRDADDRSRSELLGVSPADDIRDPVDQPARVWRSVAGEIDTALTALLATLYPRRPVTTSTP
jgi:protein-tyrosine phosphatase